MQVRRRVRQAIILSVLAIPSLSLAQTTPELRQILERLDRLESENKSLREEVRALREQLIGTARATAHLRLVTFSFETRP